MHVSDLIDMLASDDQAMRRQAAELLSQNVDVAVDVATALVQHVGDDDRVVAEYCVATLEELGPPPASQLDDLACLASAENTDVAYWAVTLIGRCGVAAVGQAQLLGELVASDAATNVRERAAWALGRIGPAASAALPQLESAARASPESLARAVAKALEAIRE